MREIKFRAWDKVNKKMITSEGYLTIWQDGRWHISQCQKVNKTDEIVELLIDRDGILMQFTGLLDKQGKEIYEGDIVKECSWIDWGTNKTRLWKKGREIVWNDIEASFVFKEEDGSLDCFSLNNKCGYEVIGNICENPELLRKD